VQVQLKNGGAVQTTYAFDGQGKRSVKVAVQQSGANRTFTLYSGTQILSEFNDASTATYTAGTTPGQAPADSVSLLLYQHSDQTSTRMATDNFGNVAYQHGNYPYGDTWYEAGGAMPNVPRKFTTYRMEPELSGFLNHAMAREHSARLGRFHRPDEVPGNRLSSQGLNRYAYAGDDPVNRWDPDGLSGLWNCATGWCALPPFLDGGGGGGGGCDPFGFDLTLLGPDYPIDGPVFCAPVIVVLPPPTPACVAFARWDTSVSGAVICNNSTQYTTVAKLYDSPTGNGKADLGGAPLTAQWVAAEGVNTVSTKMDSSTTKVFTVSGRSDKRRSINRFFYWWTFTWTCDGITLKTAMTPVMRMTCGKAG
jgi:RHS repeat-associated protein